MVTTVRELRRLQTAYELTTSDAVRDVIEDAFCDVYDAAPLRIRLAYLVTAHARHLRDELRLVLEGDFPGWLRRKDESDESRGGAA